MPYPNRSNLGSLLAIIVVLASPAASSTCAEYPVCQFNDEDSSDCRDYGLVNNAILVPWYVGSQDCMDAYNIQITSIDPSTSCASASAFVNSLRFGDLSSSTSKLGLGVSQDGFFEQQDGSGGTTTIVLKDNITIDGTTYDCTASEADCYNAMKPYFESNEDGMLEMQQVCETLYDKVRADKQLEQSTLRIRLCDVASSGSAVDGTCEPLATQVAGEAEAYGVTKCSALGFGVGNKTIEPCGGSGGDGGNSTGGSGGNGGSNTSAAAMVVSSPWWTAATGLWLFTVSVWI
jgi:hypothetical protein